MRASHSRGPRASKFLLQEISCGGEGDDQAGAEVHSGLTADKLDGGLGPGELGQ
jgi:hypothetical protein